MRYRSWPIITVAFSALLLLMAFAGREVLDRAGLIQHELIAVQTRATYTDRLVRELRSERYHLGLLVREYLLDATDAGRRETAADIAPVRARIKELLAELSAQFPNGPELSRIRRSLDETWVRLDQTLRAGSRSNVARTDRESLLRLRQEFVSDTREVESLIRSGMLAQQEQVAAKQQQYESYVRRVIAMTALLGVALAGGTIYRTQSLERRTDRLLQETTKKETELRSLSSLLVRAQEDERRRISRELHDELGQILTALRLEVGNIEKLRCAGDGSFEAHSAEAKELAERAMREIRGMALALRPSMLDDLGLGPALEWQAREFTRRTRIPVEMRLEGEMEQLTEPHRTYIYRIIQEALTNCARHSQARAIHVTVRGRPDRVSLSVEDDGVGFGHNREGERGLGLISMEERIRELNGRLSIESLPKRGTLLKAEIPVTGGTLA